MKDEEMADKYAEEYVMREDIITENDRVPFDNGYGFQTVSFEEEVKKGYKDGFLAGLKAGRPQWHDLRKDPNDLPKEDCQVITVGKSPRRLLIKKVAYYLRSEKKFTIWNKEYENFTNLHRVIAWCEIPTFEKE